jgi:hypothetical protein
MALRSTATTPSGTRPAPGEGGRWTLAGIGEGLLRMSFPVALLLLGTFFLGGRIGFWSDDYWHNLRDPVTGRLPPMTFSGLTMNRGFFLRPLFYMIVPPVTTLAWKTQWPAHLLQTGVHGLVAALLWRLMRELGLSRRASAAAALMFMAYPGHFEAVFWTAALPTAIATALMLRLMTVYVRYARREGPFAGGGGWWAVAAMPALVFIVCCLNEQPAMGVLALPLVYRAAVAARGARAGSGRAEELRRALGPALVCGIAVLVYTALVLLDPHKPAGARGSAQQFVTPGELPERTAYFVNVLWRRIVLMNFWRGALGMGWEAIRAAGLVSVAVGTLVVVQGVLCARRWVGSQSEEAKRGPAGGRVALAGAAVFLTGWVPILMMAVYEPDARTRYWPAVGLALVLAAGFARAERAASSRAVRVMASAALLAVLLLFATMQIGIQSAFRQRWQFDHAQARELRELVPSPTPYTFFVPLGIADAGGGIHTGAPVFDAQFRSVWEFPWTTWKFIESAYGRDDVRCGYWRHWKPGEPVAGAGPRGILYTDVLGPRFPMDVDGWRIPWDRCIPFVVDERGRVHLVTLIRATGVGSLAGAYPIPQVQNGVRSGRIPARAVDLPAR